MWLNIGLKEDRQSLVNFYAQKSRTCRTNKTKSPQKLIWRLSYTPLSADPRHGQVFDNYIPSYNYHVRASFAIIAAYSIIEEIQFGIRSSAKKSRFIKVNETATWNPTIYSDMEAPLSSVGLSCNRNFHWVERGDLTEVQKEIKPNFGQLIYKGHKIIRDLDMELIEAIHRCSYIRNFIVAHKFKSYTQYISPYDVFNVQSVARLLLLHKLNLWETSRSWRTDIKVK